MDGYEEKISRVAIKDSSLILMEKILVEKK